MARDGVRRRPTELRALTEQVIARVVSARDGGRVLLDAPFPITMSIDGLRIERVLATLIGNALEHSPRDNQIVVRLEAAALSGLHASQLIVEAHGGKLDVERVPGQGSRFYFDLPAIST